MNKKLSFRVNLCPVSNVFIPNHAKTPSYHSKPYQSNTWFVYLYWRLLIKSLHRFIYLFACSLPHLSINTTYHVGEKTVGKEKNFPGFCEPVPCPCTPSTEDTATAFSHLAGVWNPKPFSDSEFYAAWSRLAQAVWNPFVILPWSVAVALTVRTAPGPAGAPSRAATAGTERPRASPARARPWSPEQPPARARSLQPGGPRSLPERRSLAKLPKLPKLPLASTPSAGGSALL